MAIAGADTRGYNVLDSCRVAKQRVVEIHLAPDDRWMKAMSSVWNRPVVAAAGGINAGNVAAYAEAGADIVVTSSPYLAKPCDVQVHIALAEPGQQLMTEAA